jgi:hypothetical protein
VSGTGRPVTDYASWMRSMERRLAALERRPALHTAAQLLGPGIAPVATLTADWSDEATLFNGMFYSLPGAQHSPDSDRGWIGWSLVDADGSGYQRVASYGSDPSPGEAFTRGFTSAVGASRTFSAWVAE